MWFSRKQVVKSPQVGGAQSVVKSAGDASSTVPRQITTKSRGDAAEGVARAYLVRAGLRFVAANYRTPGRGGGEIDLVMRAPDGTLVFVEVRQRSGASHGGAGASISAAKQQRIILAARHYLVRFASPPPCRFDVLLVQGALGQIEWLPAAFDAS
ncbi:YraN family protein [Polaromonas sp.]|jgi:putative endonuclease|uniref:YraN family protein n=1 Tax=Polaromonas sp. TaxID=1869339 RepID=UPI001D2B98EA|nr:YraN family protein [Polaromonas sp.]MBT9475047.1 YraN family protein [Polaromonas sp.]